MVQIQSRSTVAVPAEFAFTYTADFLSMPEWMYGMQTIRAVGDIASGLGARYEGAVKIGATLQSTIEVTGYEPHRLISTESRSGIANQSCWQFRALGDELTEIDTTVDYHLPGGLAGRVLGKAIEPFMAIAVTSSENTLRSVLEHRYQLTKSVAK